MRRVLEILKTGDWITRERMRLVALAVLIASTAGLVFLVVTSDGLNDRLGRPLGTDFSNVYAAGTYVLDGRAAAPFDPAPHYAREQAIFGAGTPFYGWHYPPFFLFVAAVLAHDALRPRAGRLAGDHVRALPLAMRRDRSIAATPHPHEQDGGALMMAPLAARLPGRVHQSRARPQRVPHRRAVRRRAGPARPRPIARRHPVRAARLQAAIRPDDPAGAGRHRTLARDRGGRRDGGGCSRSRPRSPSASTSGAHSSPLRTSRARSCSSRATPAGTRSRACSPGCGCGAAPSPLAYAAQAAATLAVAAALVWLWRSRAAFPLKAAGAAASRTVLATPYSLDYDLMVLAPAHRLPGGRRNGARLRTVGEDHARRAVDRAAGRPRARAGDAGSARGRRPDRDVPPRAASQRERHPIVWPWNSPHRALS